MFGFRAAWAPLMMLVVLLGSLSPAAPAVPQAQKDWPLGILTGGLLDPATTTEEVETSRTLPVLVLSGPILEMRDPFDIFGTGGETLSEILAAIDRAAKDEDVPALVVKLEDPALSLSQAQEIHDRLATFKESGKPVWALMDTANLVEYVIVAPADRIVMPPVGGLEIYGLNAQMYFFRDLLGKLGVQAQAITTGQFKNAMEPFTHQEMSAATREQMLALVQDMGKALTRSVAEARGMTTQEASTAIFNGPYTTSMAYEAKLITDIEYPNAFLERMSGEANAVLDYEYFKTPKDSVKPPSLMSILMGGGGTRRATKGLGGPRIALVYATGPIVDGRAQESFLGREEVIASEDFLELLDEVMEGDTKAIVMRVDSPGGSAIASDRIWHRLEEIQAEGVPVVVSMGDVAASGGYYISMGADRIFAYPATITGSIGVVGGRLILGELYRKIGLNRQSIVIGEHADMMDETKAWEGKDLQLLQAILDEVYEQFTSKAALSRSMPQERIKELGGGRIWSGMAAKENGLIDELGGLDDAVAAARELAEEPDAPIARFPKEMTLQEFIENILSGDVEVQTQTDGLSLLLAREEVLGVLPARMAGALRQGWMLLGQEEPRVLLWEPMVVEWE